MFTDKRKCEQAEAESKTAFVNKLLEDIELIKDICNSHPYCEDCPFADGSGDCIATPLQTVISKSFATYRELIID